VQMFTSKTPSQNSPTLISHRRVSSLTIQRNKYAIDISNDVYNFSYSHLVHYRLPRPCLAPWTRAWTVYQVREMWTLLYDRSQRLYKLSPCKR